MIKKVKKQAKKKGLKSKSPMIKKLKMMPKKQMDKMMVSIHKGEKYA